MSVGAQDVGTTGDASFAERLELAMGKETPSAFARRAGIQDSLLRKYLAGSVPGLDKAAAIAEAAGVSLDWLATGAGSMGRGYLSSSDVIQRAIMGPRPAPKQLFAVPRLDIEAALGPGALTESENIEGHLGFEVAWITQFLGCDPGNLVVITGVGDSMEPTIRSGDLLLVDTGIAKVLDDGIYALVDDGFLKVKRVQQLGQRGVKVISDNAAYDSYTLTPAEAAEVRWAGRIRWIGRVI